MKKLFCICILICLLLTSCGGGGEDLNVYTTEPRPETSAPQSSDTLSSDSETSFVVKTHDIPEELREYVDNYTYEPSDDADDQIIRRLVCSYAVSGGYLYYIDTSINYSGETNKTDVMKRLNLITGEISSPCFDPICTHDTVDCDFCFFNIFNIQAFGKYIAYYTRENPNSSAKGHLYDTTTGEVHKEVFNKENYSSLSVYFGYTGDSLYNSITKRSDNPDTTGEHDRTIYDKQIWEYHIPTRQLTMIRSTISTNNVGGFIVAYKGRIYFYNDDGMVHSMLPDGSDVRNELNFVQGDFYSSEDAMWTNGISDNSVVKTNVTNGQRTVVLPASEYEVSYQVTNNYLYYCYKVPVKAENGSKTFQTEIRRSDHDGNNAEKLITLDFEVPSGTFIYGNYLYAKESVTEGTQRIIKIKRIHLETGEILYIE